MKLYVCLFSNGHLSLNPFEIRAGLKAKTAIELRDRGGLNPFEIRAGLKPEDYKEATIDWRLNPFEIRAGLKL